MENELETIKKYLLEKGITLPAHPENIEFVSHLMDICDELGVGESDEQIIKIMDNFIR